MMKAASFRHMREVLLPALAVALVGVPTLARAQWISVIDGYDKQGYYPTASALAFDPSVPKGWTLYYVTGRHLRAIRSAMNFETQTYPYLSEKPSDYLRLLYSSNTGDEPPYVAYYDHFDQPRLHLQYWSDYTWYPVFASYLPSEVFDVVFAPAGSFEPIEWAYTERLSFSPKYQVVHVYFQSGAFIADTLGAVRGTSYRFGSLRFLRHDHIRKSIAVSTDSAFSVYYWNNNSWQCFQMLEQSNSPQEIQGGTLLDGAPFWVVEEKFIQLGNAGLIAETLPLPGSLYFRCLAVQSSSNGDVHAIHEIRQLNSLPQLQYSRREGTSWTTESIPIAGANDVAITTVQDTVVVAAATYFDGKIRILTRLPSGVWQSRLGEAAGDVGIDLSIAPNEQLTENMIAYYDRTNGDLKIARGENNYGTFSNWRVQRVDSVGNVGRLPNAIVVNDTLHVVYLDDANGLLKYGWQTRNEAGENGYGVWHSEMIDTIGAVQTRFNLIYDSNGRLRIAYQDADAGAIKMAARDGAGWSIQTVDHAQVDSPSELRLFQKQDSLCIGFVQNQRLRLLAGERLGEQWSVTAIPHQAAAVYATWGIDFQEKIHAVYRARAGFQDEIRHVYHDGAEWVDRKILTTSANGMRLHLKQINLYSKVLMLALTDNGIPQLYCLSGDSWFRIAHGQRFAEDTGLDFLGFGFGTIVMYYRALSTPATAYDDQPSPELVEDVVFNVIDAIQQAERSRTAAEFSAFPNPFNLMTTIKFNLERTEQVTIKIYNTLGQEVRTLANKTLLAGEHSASWDGRDHFGSPVSSGVYLARSVIGKQSFSKKLVLMK